MLAKGRREHGDRDGYIRYFEEIRRFPMLEPQDEFMLGKRWREHGDRDAAHKLITSHLRLVAKIAMGYRGYGLPISEVLSEGNIGLLQAVKRFEPEKGFRLATYARWWIKATIQEYILHSWSLVKLGTSVNQKKLFFNLRKAKSKLLALEEGDLQPDQVKLIARRLAVTEQDVIDMNRRLGGDVSLNAPIGDERNSGEWQDSLVDEVTDQETWLAEREEADNRSQALGEASRYSMSGNGASSRRGGSPTSRSFSRSSPLSSASRASAYGRSRYVPLRRCRRWSGTASPRSKLRRSCRCIRTVMGT